MLVCVKVRLLSLNLGLSTVPLATWFAWKIILVILLSQMHLNIRQRVNHFFWKPWSRLGLLVVLHYSSLEFIPCFQIISLMGCFAQWLWQDDVAGECVQLLLRYSCFGKLLLTNWIVANLELNDCLFWNYVYLLHALVGGRYLLRLYLIIRCSMDSALPIGLVQWLLTLTQSLSPMTWVLVGPFTKQRLAIFLVNQLHLEMINTLSVSSALRQRIVVIKTLHVTLLFTLEGTFDI